MDKTNYLIDYNPLTRMDYPDPDVIRVEDTYYMISTTMHFLPGGVILRSYDLKNWEIAAYVYDHLDDTPGQCLEDGIGIYGKGMWAASLRYHNGTFYVCFACNDTHKTYLYTSDSIDGEWKKQTIEGFYHDCSLYFEEDGNVFIVYGNRDIHLTQLKEDLSGPKPGGLDRIIVSDTDNPNLGYEGSHLYKINGKYYVFFIHSKRDRWLRTEACFMADSLDGEFVGRDVFEDDRDYCGSGVAQGGIVDTPDGDWYAVLFQDSGAIGRLPILLPIHFEGDWPVFGIDGKVPVNYEVKSTRPEYQYAPLYGNAFAKDNVVQSREAILQCEAASECCNPYDSRMRRLAPYWQFNHTPVNTLWDVTENSFAVKTGKIVEGLCQAQNILTQRMLFPQCEAEVTLDFSDLKEGDFAGICAFQSCYGFVGVTVEAGKPQLVMVSVEAEGPEMFKLMDQDTRGVVCEKLPVDGSKVRLRLEADFWKMKDTVNFYYREMSAYADVENEESAKEFTPIGKEHRVFFKLDHFCGCRVGLFAYATKEAGGRAVFSDFKIQ